MTLQEAKDYTRWLANIAAVVIIGGVVLSALIPIGRDDTDAPWPAARSGIVPVTDAATGCQYLLSPHGGITPRLNQDSQHIGCTR